MGVGGVSTARDLSSSSHSEAESKLSSSTSNSVRNASVKDAERQYLRSRARFATSMLWIGLFLFWEPGGSTMASKAMAVVIGLAMASVACAGLEQCEKPPAVKKSRDGAKISRRGRICSPPYPVL